jgi:hypothetical protein
MMAAPSTQAGSGTVVQDRADGSARLLFSRPLQNVSLDGHHPHISAEMPLQLSPSEQLTHATARIECTLMDGSRSTGSGFFFQFLRHGDQHVPAIVTNKHVVAGSKIGQFSLTLRRPDGGPQIGKHISLELDKFESRWIQHPSPEVDLAIMPIAPLLEEAGKQGHTFFFVALDSSLIMSDAELSDLSAIEDVVMIGYPNGIWDAVNNMLVIRRGVTATHPNLDYEGRREFMIDAACFPGSSGSPVFLYNVGGWADRQGNMMMGGIRVKLLGALYAGPQHTAEGDIHIVNVPTQQKPVALSRIPNNLGLVIKASRLLDFDDVLRPLIR